LRASCASSQDLRLPWDGYKRLIGQFSVPLFQWMLVSTWMVPVIAAAEGIIYHFFLQLAGL
jgi:hypothetical protein